MHIVHGLRETIGKYRKFWPGWNVPMQVAQRLLHPPCYETIQPNQYKLSPEMLYLPQVMVVLLLRWMKSRQMHPACHAKAV